MLSAVGISLFILESFVPIPVPFINIWLANAASLVALMAFAPADMFLVVIVRIVVGALLVGSMFSPTFLVSFGGGISAAAAMALTRILGRNLFGVMGISIVGSTVHVVAQLFVVSFLFVRNDSLLILLPVLLTSGLIGGLIVGWVSSKIMHVIRT
jgi:heptaprenyl diphosphate synthase